VIDPDIWRVPTDHSIFLVQKLWLHLIEEISNSVL